VYIDLICGNQYPGKSLLVEFPYEYNAEMVNPDEIILLFEDIRDQINKGIV